MSDETRHRNAGLWLAFGIIGALLAALELFALILWVVVGSPPDWRTLLIFIGFVLLTLVSTYYFRRWTRGRGARLGAPS